MRLIAGVFMILSTILSVVIFLLADSLLFYTIAIIPMIIAFLLSRAISLFAEKDRTKIQNSRKDKMTEEEKLIDHLLHPIDYCEELIETHIDKETIEKSLNMDDKQLSVEVVKK